MVIALIISCCLNEMLDTGFWILDTRFEKQVGYTFQVWSTLNKNVDGNCLDPWMLLERDAGSWMHDTIVNLQKKTQLFKKILNS
jgi:hypothetical protein